MLTDAGFCSSCRRWAQDHPAGLACPWCGDRTVPAAANVDADPLGALRYVAAERRRLLNLMLGLEAVRREAARVLLAHEELPRGGYRLGTLESWARSPADMKCRKGHSRAEFGEYYPIPQRWACRACEQERAAAKPRKSREEANLRARWAAHERRLAAARAAGPVDRLRDELPPPVRPS